MFIQFDLTHKSKFSNEKSNFFKSLADFGLSKRCVKKKIENKFQLIWLKYFLRVKKKN